MVIVPADVMPHYGGNPDSLFAQVADRIALSIVSGAVAPGDLVPNEAAIGDGHPVSRSVYREALKFLSAKGLIEARPKSGTRAAPASTWNLLDPDVLRWSLSAGANEKYIHDLYELRSFIEPNAARLAALRRTSEQARALRIAVDGMAASIPYSQENIRCDLAFHEALLDACGNHALMCLKSVVMTTLMWALSIQVGKSHIDYASALSDHQRLCEAIEQQDGERAKTVMTLLVHDALHDTLSIFRKRKTHPGFRNAAE